MISKAVISKMIIFYANIYGLDSNVALSVAMHESSLNPKAIGAAREVGLFQLKSEYVSGYTRKQLFDPVINIQVGIQKLLEAKRTCKHQKKNQWLTCYNLGRSGASKIKHPELFPYVKSVNALIASNK